MAKLVRVWGRCDGVESMATRAGVSLALMSVCFTVAPACLAQDVVPGVQGPSAPTNEQVIKVPVGHFPSSATLVVTVLKPDGPGPFPLAVMNHGTNGALPPAQQPRYVRTFSAWYFLSRGYEVALPMMRGYAGSSGQAVLHNCDAAAMGLDDANDIRAVIDYMARQPGVDSSRVVVAGQSFGGWNTLAVGSLDIPNVKAIVNFVGGLQAPNCAGVYGDELARGAAHYGASTKVPSLWFYGDNDRLFPPAISSVMYRNYTRAGGKAKLIAFAGFEKDAHNMLGSAAALKMWVPEVDALLQRVGLPGKLINSGYLPAPLPPASGYADISDDAAVPYLNDKGRAFYLSNFLAQDLPRALVIGQNGWANESHGGYDPAAQALAECARKNPSCQLYAVDDQVVWKHPNPTPPPSHFAALDDAAALPYGSASARDGYAKFLAARKPRAFVIAPDGGWMFAARGPDPLRAALDACAAKHQGCRVYAVDGDVVWTDSPPSPAPSAQTIPATKP